MNTERFLTSLWIKLVFSNMWMQYVCLYIKVLKKKSLHNTVNVPIVTEQYALNIANFKLCKFYLDE